MKPYLNLNSLVPRRAVVCGLMAVTALAGCSTTESTRPLEVGTVKTASTPYSGPRTAVAVGKFDNRSSYMRGAFAEGPDQLASQSQTILISHLQQSQRFSVMDRENLAEANQESQIKGQARQVKGADYLVTGAVSEFGRKEVGDMALFGLLGRGKSQVAYAKVTLTLVNSRTSEVVASTQGAGEVSLSNREVVGFGSTASYDATLNGKVLDLAIREAINALVAKVDDGSVKFTP
jgi:curli biogenesis system outer membrane secretion channel CsgG